MKSPSLQKKSITALLAGLLLAGLLQLPSMAGAGGTWKGEITLPGQVLKVEIELVQKDGKWNGTIDIPQQQAKDLPLSEIKVEGDQVSFKIAGVPGDPTFTGKLSKNHSKLSGNFVQGGQSFTFALENAAASGKKDDKLNAKLSEELRALAQKALQTWKTPGFALAVVKDGQVILSEGFGLRDVEKKLPVDQNTLFAIGSSSKAFTATALGMLVDRGLLEWDKPIHPFLPDFELSDPVATNQMSARDLLTHRSGLPRHDVSWYGSPSTRQELYARLRHLQPTAPFRSRFQYQNLMFMTAGLLLEDISGKSWEDFVRDEIFKPLGMKRTITDTAGMLSDANQALPYGVKGDKPVKLNFRKIEAIGPAGGILSTIEDMGKWLRFNLGNGSLGEERLLEAQTLSELHAPQIVVSGTGSPESPYVLYGLGWFVQPYRGHTLIQHGGNIDGYTAMVALMPQDNIGVVILSNRNGDALPTALMNAIHDKLLGLDAIDWNQRLKGGSTEQITIKQVEYPQVKNTRPSHELNAYTGLFADPGYGELSVSLKGGELQLNFRDLGGKLKHWHYDSFRLENPDSLANGQMVSFITNELGHVDTLQLSFEIEAEPLRFQRQPEPRLSLAATLKQYEGRYSLGPTSFTVKLQAGRLLAQVPNQPVFELEPYREHFFKLKNYPGFMARFELRDGKVEAVELIQPNGVFKATKVN